MAAPQLRSEKFLGGSSSSGEEGTSRGALASVFAAHNPANPAPTIDDLGAHCLPTWSRRRRLRQIGNTARRRFLLAVFFVADVQPT